VSRCFPPKFSPTKSLRDREEEVLRQVSLSSQPGHSIKNTIRCEYLTQPQGTASCSELHLGRMMHRSHLWKRKSGKSLGGEKNGILIWVRSVSFCCISALLSLSQCISALLSLSARFVMAMEKILDLFSNLTSDFRAIRRNPCNHLMAHRIGLFVDSGPLCCCCSLPRNSLMCSGLASRLPYAFHQRLPF
jgi:hypothetical protein